VSQIGAILAIDELFVALEFPTNGTGRALESPGNISFGPTAYAKLGDVVAFVLRELVVSQLSHFLARVLHLLLESTRHNKSLQLSPQRPFRSEYTVWQFHVTPG
jgi:hypothetical protein